MVRAMRRLLVLSLVVAAALATGLGAEAAELARTPGSESLSLRNGTGRAVIWQRGSILGRIRNGRLVVVDLSTAHPTTVIVRGHESREVLDESTTVYIGRDMSFRIFGSAWRVRVRGRGINVSGIVRGWLRLVGTKGTFAIGESKYRRWPTELQTFKLAT